MQNSVKTLREWRVSRLLSLRDLAGAAGVTPKTILDLEMRRRRATFATIRKLADGLGVDPTEVAEFVDALDQRAKNRHIEGT
jgi:transcriptional regulator with XRE-family HTH domain